MSCQHSTDCESLDLTQYEAGPSATQALAWFGADVVKVEPPGHGDPARGIDNMPRDYFMYWNCNKRSVTIDLASTEGRQLLLDLAPKFDVFVENYGPGVVEKLDIDYEAVRAVHPGVIYASVKGYGTFGPYADRKCFDGVAQATAGALSTTGNPDGPTDAPRADHRRLRYRRAAGVGRARRLRAEAADRRRSANRDLDAGGDDLLHAHAGLDGSRLGRAAQPRGSATVRMPSSTCTRPRAAARTTT